MSPSQICLNYGTIIGSVIGSFVLALVLGVILGLLCGVRHSSVRADKQSCKNSKSKYDITLSKGPLYDEVQVEQHVELSKNISYDVVKKI